MSVRGAILATILGVSTYVGLLVAACRGDLKQWPEVTDASVATLAPPNDFDGNYEAACVEAYAPAPPSNSCVCPTNYIPNDASSCSASPDAGSEPTPIPCRTPILVGALVNPDPPLPDGGWQSPQVILDLENAIGRRLDIDLGDEGVVFGGDGGDAGKIFPNGEDFRDFCAGRIPMVSVNCLSTSDVASLLTGGDGGGIALEAKSLASDIAQFPGPVILRYCWEMDGQDKDAATGTNAGVDAGTFVAEWKYLYYLMHPIRSAERGVALLSHGQRRRRRRDPLLSLAGRR